MARTNEEITSLCDRIMAFCTRVNKRLDEDAEFSSSFHGQPVPQPRYTAAGSQNRRSDYMLPKLQTDQPQPPTYWDTSWQPPQQHQQPRQPYHQPPQHYEQHHAHHQYDLPQPVQPFHPYPQPPLPYTLPQANPNSCWDPPWACLPTAPLQNPAPAYITPWQTTVETYFDNQPQPYFHNTDPYRQPTSRTYTDSWQQEQLVYRQPPPPPQHYFHTQPPPSHDYHQPLLTAALPHQNYPHVPPPKTYQPPPPPPLILDCDRVEESFADSTKKIPDSSVGFGGVEKVEKMVKYSPDSTRKEKPVQGCIEIECSRQLNASPIKILQAQIELGDSIVDNASLELLGDSSHVADVASTNHRSTSLDSDARLIPPQNNTPCLGIGCVDKLHTSVVLNYLSHNLQATQKSSHQLMDDFSNLGGERCTNLTEMKQGVRSVRLEESLIVNYGLLELTSTVDPFLSAMGNKLFSFESHVGTSSKSKIILDLLEVIHFVASLEANSLSTQAGLRGIDEGRRLTIWCAFDPGGDGSPKLLFATLLVVSMLLVVSWFPP